MSHGSLGSFLETQGFLSKLHSELLYFESLIDPDVTLGADNQINCSRIIYWKFKGIIIRFLNINFLKSQI